jgi:hypothetical protein
MYKSIRGELETLEVQLLLKKALVDGRGKLFGFHNLRHGVSLGDAEERGHEEQTFIQSLLRETFIIAGELF